MSVVFLLWDTDSNGVYLHSIWSTREKAEEMHGHYPNDTWIEEREVDDG
jgi:hypothetical protein